MADRRSRLGVAWGSGVLMALAAAPLNWWGLAWVAMVPLWLAVQPPISESDKLARQRSWMLSVLWGLGYHGTVLFWITGLHPLTWLGIPWVGSVAIALVCWLFITLWGTAIPVIWVWSMIQWQSQVARKTAPNSAWVIVARWLTGVALWCGLESLWSLGPLYWSTLSLTQSPGNLVILHLGQLTGPIAVTAAIVATNGLLAAAWQTRHLAKAQAGLWLTIALGLGLGLHGLGLVLYSQPLNSVGATALPVGIIQGNVPTRVKLTPAGIQRSFTGYLMGYQTLATQGAAAVLTPEGALPITWGKQTKMEQQFQQAIATQGVVVWLGTFVADQHHTTQSLLTLDSQGSVVGHYNKVKLVPLGEYIPFQSVLGNLIGRLSPIDSRTLPGELGQQFETPFGRAIASICYESAFPNLFRTQAAQGGQFIVTASNLDPYNEVLMAQHQALDIMRAIETDRWVVRATNTGYSGIVNPHGQVVWRSTPYIYQTHLDTIFRRQTQTLYTRWGNWLVLTLLILAAIVSIRTGWISLRND